MRDPKKQPTLRLRQPVFTQAEADQRAKAALNERAKQFLTGEGETIGLPEIRPDRNVELDKLGVPFSKTYYIQQATHKIDAQRLSHALQGEGDRAMNLVETARRSETAHEAGGYVKGVAIARRHAEQGRRRAVPREGELSRGTTSRARATGRGWRCRWPARTAASC